MKRYDGAAAALFAAPGGGRAPAVCCRAGPMINEKMVDEESGRAFYLDAPSEPGEALTVVLNLHGGGSFGAWQRLYFPAFQLVDAYGLVVATPTAATELPVRRWVAEADDAHLRQVVRVVVERFGEERIAALWLAGHSQGGLTANRLLTQEWFASRVDGWLSLSGGRLGPARLVEGFGPPPNPAVPPMSAVGPRPRIGEALAPSTDLSFLFAVGEHEIAELPETSPWAERYGAGPRVALEDVVDDEPGLVYDKRREGNSSPSWGLLPRPGRARVFVYPGAAGGFVIGDVVRLDKGHTEGLEPRITERLVRLMVGAPGGKVRRRASAV